MAITNGMGLFDLFDQVTAKELGVSVEVYIDTIDKFDEQDMEYIIHTVLNPNATQDDKDKAKQLFNSKIEPKN